MMRAFLFVIIGLLTLGISKQASSSTADTLSYRIRIPATQRLCATEAQSLADRFQQLSPAQIIDARCSGQSTLKDDNSLFQFYIVDLNYSLSEDDFLKKVFSSYYGQPSLGFSSNNYEGLYARLRDCLHDLPARTFEFAQNTGHEVLASTCERALSDYDTSFVIRIDTIGEPEIRLDATADLATKFATTPLAEAVKKIILANQGKIVVHRDGFFYYYSKESIEPYHHTFGEMQQQECQEQLPELQRILKRIPTAELTLGCVKKTYGPRSFYLMETVWNHFRMLDSSMVEERYPNYQECRQDKNRLIENYRSRGFRITGALCRVRDLWSGEETERPYQIEIYFK